MAGVEPGLSGRSKGVDETPVGNDRRGQLMLVTYIISIVYVQQCLVRLAISGRTKTGDGTDQDCLSKNRYSLLGRQTIEGRFHLSLDGALE